MDVPATLTSPRGECDRRAGVSPAPDGRLARRWFPNANRTRTYEHEPFAYLLDRVVAISILPPGEDAQREQARRLLYSRPASASVGGHHVGM
jgi:hypothetical protein